MKCPQCGLVTFDDLPQCPRCKESFALVRPLASTSLDGARHVLRDDPELRLKLRDRLHRARLDRRKRNENPMATGPDPDAPDWFEPEPGGDNGAAEAMLAAAPATGERSEEREVVYTDDLSPDDNMRGRATADTDAEIIEASREFDNTEAPEFQGDIPGFTDWREELRERLKRIRARRDQERLAEGDTDEDAVAAAEDTLEEDTDTGADIEAAPEEDDEPTAELEAAPEEDDELVAEEPTAEIIGFAASLKETNGDAESGADIDFTLDTAFPVADPDLDLSGGLADESPSALILGEKKAEASVPDAEGLDDLIAEEASSPPGEETSDESVTEPLEASGWGEDAAEERLSTEAVDASDLDVLLSTEAVDAADLEEEEADEASETAPADPELPAALMPDLPAIDGVPELDFNDAPVALAASPEIDLPAVEETGDQALEWDREEAVAEPTTASSAGPLGERAAAAVCDMLILTAIGTALVGAASSATALPFRQILRDEALWLSLAWSIFAIGYSVFFVGSCGQTIGRMIMRLRVVGDDQFSVGFDRAAIRLAAWVLSALPLLGGVLPALRDPQRRALHDRLSHTRVVKA